MIAVSPLFEGLMRTGIDGHSEPAIAESIEVSEDGKIYTFHLRKTKWSNGDPLTAHDFEYAWKRALAPAFIGDYAYQLYFVKGAQKAKEGRIPTSQVGVTATDDYTLVVQLENPTPFFLQLLTIPTYYPLHRQTIERNPNWALEAGPDYIGNGPFVLKEWTHHNQFVFERNPYYWDAAHVKLSKIVAMIVPDSNTELALFEDGSLDWAGKPLSMGLPTDSLPTLKKEGRLYHQPLAATYFYVFNINKPPFTNAKIRRAFALAMNRRDIVTNVTQGGELPATCIVGPPMSLQGGECFRDGDVKQAKKLFAEGLKELGMTKEQLPSVTLSYNTSEAHHKVAQAVQQQWAEAFGINVILENLEWKVYLDKINHQDFSIARLGWQASYSDPAAFLELFKFRDSPINFTKWEDPRFIKLMDESLVTKDPAQRRQLLAQAEQIVVEQMPIIPVYFQSSSYLKDPHLKGEFFNQLGDVDFRHAYFVED